MTITTVHAVHFSPTGTVEKTVCRIARNLAKSLGAAYKEFSYAVPANREKELSFTENDLVVWGSPTYAGRVPNLLLPYLTGCLIQLYTHCRSSPHRLPKGGNGVFHPDSTQCYVGDADISACKE